MRGMVEIGGTNQFVLPRFALSGAFNIQNQYKGTLNPCYQGFCVNRVWVNDVPLYFNKHTKLSNIQVSVYFIFHQNYKIK